MNPEAALKLDKALWAATEAAEDALAVADGRDASVLATIVAHLSGIRRFYIDVR